MLAKRHLQRRNVFSGPHGFRELTLPARRSARKMRADAHFARIFTRNIRTYDESYPN
jgi:hypothetical protein